MITDVKMFNLLETGIFYVINEKENVSLLESCLHKYVLFSVHVTLLSTVLLESYARRNIPITNKEQLHKPDRYQNTGATLIEPSEK